MNFPKEIIPFTFFYSSRMITTNVNFFSDFIDLMNVPHNSSFTCFMPLLHGSVYFILFMMKRVRGTKRTAEKGRMLTDPMLKEGMEQESEGESQIKKCKQEKNSTGGRGVFFSGSRPGIEKGMWRVQYAEYDDFRHIRPP